MLDEFESQAVAFRERIEKELAEDKLIFPTSFDASIRIKHLADDPDASLAEIARVVLTEPVLSARVVLIAKTASEAPNPFDNLIGRSRQRPEDLFPAGGSGGLVREAIASARASRQQMHAAICG